MGVGRCQGVAVVLLITAASFVNGAHASSARLRETSVSKIVDTPASTGLLSGEKSPERVAGYFKLNRHHTTPGEMFYLYFENRARSDDAPVVIWLTGGPGCSSEIAVFFENGPFSLTPDGEVKEREYGWDVEANMIFVDSPLNVGYSYSEDPEDRVFTEPRVSADLLDFLQEFFKARPKLAKNDFFVTGESYAGHYIPVFAAKIWRHNEHTAADNRINLKGVAIGNGLTDPGNQYGSYAAFAESNGLISSTASGAIQLAWPICKAGISVCNDGIDLACDAALVYCQMSQFAPVLAIAAGINIYDIRKQCVSPLCYDFSIADKYLNDADTKRKFGVPAERRWQECDMTVNAQFEADFMRDYSAEVAFLLEKGLRVLIYAGDQDLICNDLGQEIWTKALVWSGQAEFNSAEVKAWSVDGKVAGSVRAAGAFTHVTVADAGHMVPMDQGKHALSLLATFVKGKNFADASSGQSSSSHRGVSISWRQAASTA